jgi:2-phospho-L-lactate guanylyltransferase (CobY/MobA/RfbA family)
VASIGHQGWRQVKTNLAAKIDGRVAPPLAELVERVAQLQDEIAELKDIVTVQADVANQTTELVGRLLAAASSRIDSLEDSLRQLADTQE